MGRPSCGIMCGGRRQRTPARRNARSIIVWLLATCNNRDSKIMGFMTMLPGPVIAALVVALGTPFLLLLAIVSFSPGVSAEIFTHIVGGAIVATFLVLMGAEIKRIADQPTDAH
jgi:hypothetical protein